MALFYYPFPSIVVAVDPEGNPLAFVWDRESHVVRYVLLRWRTDTGLWVWRKWREYYRVVTYTGMIVEIYQDLVRQAWYVQRLHN